MLLNGLLAFQLSPWRPQHLGGGRTGIGLGQGWGYCEVGVRLRVIYCEGEGYCEVGVRLRVIVR